MDSDLITLINQKKSAIKTFSIKGTELNSSKSIKISGDITCNTVFCDNIEINPTGKKTEIKDATITLSSLDSTPIGLVEPSTAFVTQLNVLSTLNGNESQGINIDGDISISNSDDQQRSIKSTNPLQLYSIKDVILKSTKKITLRSEEDMCDIKALSYINLSSNIFNINTSSITSTGYLHIKNNTQSNNYTSGSLIVNGGVGIAKNLNLGQSINILGNFNSLNKDSLTHINGSFNVNKNISTTGNINIINSNNSTNINTGSINTIGGIGIHKDVHIGGLINIGGTMNINNINDSNNINSGSVIIKGGVGIAKNTNIGGNLSITNNLYIQGNIDSNNINSGSLIINGGLGIAKNINIGGNSSIYSTTDSTNINSGALIIKGGLGISKNINIGGNSSIYSTTDSNDINSGALIIKGGLGIAKNTNIGSNLNINGKTNIKGQTYIEDTTQSHNNSTGALVINGGVGIAKNLNVNGYTHIYDTSQSTTSSNGALVVNGGVGIGKDVFIDGNIYLKGSLLDESGIGTALSVASGQYNDLTILDDLIVKNEQDALNSESGSFTTEGGMGIKKSLYVGQNLNILGNATFHNNVNCVKTLYADNIFVRYNISGNNQNSGKINELNEPFDSLVGNLNLSVNLNVSNAFLNIDKWINSNLIDTPPILTYTSNTPIQGGEFIEFEWNLPTQFYVGFLNKKVPVINSFQLDYKLSSQNNWDTFTTISLNSSQTTKIRIYPITYSHNTIQISPILTYIYNFNKETLYDFRVYALNENIERPNKYLYFNSLKTISSQPTLPPTNISITKNTSNSIDVSWDHSNSSNISIYKYNINYNTISSIKYPSYINHNQDLINTSANILQNANNSITIQNLYPGHKYNINVSAKNILNTTYGELSNTNNTITTDYPIAPNYINLYTIDILNKNDYLFNINQGYSLDGSQLISNIYDYNLLDNSFQTNSIENLRINENISTTDTNTSKLFTIFNNLNQIYSNLNLNGFSYTNSSTIFTNKPNIIINNENDFYDNIYTNGFYKKADFNIQFTNPQNYLKPSINKYNLQIFQNLPYSNITYNSNKLDLYIDKLKGFSSISSINIDSLTNYQMEYISGVPTIISSNINYSFITHNLTNSFLRNDKKHFTIFTTNSNNQLFSSNLNITADSIKNPNSNMYYHNLDNSLHNSNGKILLPNIEQILFKNISLELNLTSSYTNNLHLNIIPYNLHGESPIQKTLNPIYINIDNQSLAVKNNINNSTDSFGLYVTSGNTEFPEIPDSDFGTFFDHTFNISNSLDLQLVNGYFSTPYNINAFLNYSNYFFNNTFNYFNYSSINPSTNKRYITFKYSNLINDINKITIEFIDSNINDIISTDFSLHIRIYNITQPIFNTAWLDANKSINNIGLNNNTKNINGTGCLDLYYPSTNKKKYCYLPNGSTGILYVRLGFITNKDLLIKYIKVLPGFV